MVKITASITLNCDDNSRDDLIIRITKALSKNFGKTEITNLHNVDEFMCLDIANPLAIPLLISLFSTIQLYVNGRTVNMAVLK